MCIRDSDYTEQLTANALQGKRVGVMRFAEGSNDDVKARFNAGLKAMESGGAILVEIESFSVDVENYGQKSRDVLLYEFKTGLNEYLADAALAVKPRSLEALIDFNENEPRELAIFDQDLFEAAQAKGPLSDDAYIQAKVDVQRGTGENGIDKLMAENLSLIHISEPTRPY